MSYFKVIGGGTLAAMLLSSTAVQADVTARQVWNNWKTVVQSAGQTVISGSETMTGDTLAVRDITITAKNDAATVEGKMGALDFKQRGDGTVAISIAPQYPVDITTTAKDGTKTHMVFAVTQTGMSLVVSGSPEDMTYTYDVPKLGVALTGLQSAGKDIGLKAAMTFAALKGKYIVSGTDTRTMASSSTADSLTMTASADNPDGTGTMKMQSTFSGVTATSNGTLVDAAGFEDMSKALKAGFASNGSLGYSSADYSFDFSQDGQTTQGKGNAEAGTLSFALDKDHMQYGVGCKNSTTTLTGTQIPVPQATIKLAEAAFNMLMPVSKSDTPQDFGLLLKLAGLSVNDDVWNMIDPGKNLPRDPATLIVDIVGKGNWLFDIMDPAQADHPPAVPGKLKSVEIRQLQVQAAGADLTGHGAFTFGDGTSSPEFDGMPAPDGTVDLKLVGANGLLDNLVKMGVLPEDQATSARMMMGLFAKPVEGAKDTMVSKIEVKPDGQVLANGQRIK